MEISLLRVWTYLGAGFGSVSSRHEQVYTRKASGMYNLVHTFLVLKFFKVLSHSNENKIYTLRDLQL
jgi:hypothetical protein